MHILLIEDDINAASYVIKGLKESGHVVDHASDGEEGMELSLSLKFDVIIIDRMLPKLDGLSLIKKIRDQKINTPILILSALGEVDEKVLGLKAGADDYLAKPFSFSELLARIEVLVRRTNPEIKETSIKVGSLIMNLLTRQVHRNGIEIELQPREFRLLEFLMRRSNQVVTRTMLLEGVWEYHFDPQTNVIDVHISRLRSKIDKPFDGKEMLFTERGAGYALRTDD
ncbi:MAG: response regulator transcription factor [Pseudomonadota bacterium]|nr:response regulator transcription factor [Pseudomonadota bacterium]MEC7958594.1 response regulator transcription factor [Pseudomonadota bacterium]|tara:strand:+ start:1434 stop:2114 length:681 start_codon:yes stop_codon:yes gene_type:complete